MSNIIWYIVSGIVLLVALWRYWQWFRELPPKCPNCGKRRNSRDGWDWSGEPNRSEAMFYFRCAACERRFSIFESSLLWGK